MGLTVFELEKRLQDGLAGRFLINPQVAVSVSSGSKVFILGEVRKPGSYLLAGRTTLAQLLAEAGGLSDNAGSTVTIVRPHAVGNPGSPVLSDEAPPAETITQDLRQFVSGSGGGTVQQFVLTAGDTVYVPEASKFFVTGEVKKPGEFKWEDGITVLQAVSMAGGPTDRGAPNRTEIVRTVNGVKQTIRPDMNVMVMGGDVVKVPLSYF